jgi:hypothetical protein
VFELIIVVFIISRLSSAPVYLQTRTVSTNIHGASKLVINDTVLPSELNSWNNKLVASIVRPVTDLSMIRGCIQKFPDWPPGARTANGTALRHWMYFIAILWSQSSKFCSHNPCVASQRVFVVVVVVVVYFVIYSVRKLLATPSYVLPARFEFLYIAGLQVAEMLTHKSWCALRK